MAIPSQSSPHSELYLSFKQRLFLEKPAVIFLPHFGTLLAASADPPAVVPYLRSVGNPGDHFGSHPVGSTHQGLPLRYVFTDLGTEAEIREFDLYKEKTNQP